MDGELAIYVFVQEIKFDSTIGIYFQFSAIRVFLVNFLNKASF